jgi:hypothetical protein
MVAFAAPQPVRFAPHHRWDRNAVLAGLALTWLGVLMGFGPEIARHVAREGFAYPPIVHFHALAFVGWLLLLTAQAGLIRARRAVWHRRLGFLGIALAAAMTVLGPAVALAVGRAERGSSGSDPAFLVVQLSDILAFAALAAAAFLARGNAPAHKRLILLASFYIADAGFSRWLDPSLQRILTPGFALAFAQAYLGSDLLVLAMGAYDLATRRRLHPAYAAALAFILVVQGAATALYLDPASAPLAEKLLGP